MSSLSSPSTRSKRHSLNIYPSSGPRPLQLVNGITSPTKTTTSDRVSPSFPSAFTQSIPKTPTSSNPRRHSSISYKRSSYDLNQTSSENDAPLQSQFQTKSRPKSLMYLGHPSQPNTPTKTQFVLARDNKDRRNLEPGRNTSPLADGRERPPLTLVEKHADLLRFIAQKESKCLDLRSQLAVHEAELLQLKRKWERIVSRNFESPLSPSSATTQSGSIPTLPLSSSASSSPSSANSISTATLSPIPGTVLEGIKESVQGVGKLIVSGLSVPGNDYIHHHHHSNSPSPISPQSQACASTQPRHRPKPRPHSLYSHYPSTTTSSSHTRSANLSTSFNATSSAGTRFSAASFDSSSSSLFGEEEVGDTTTATNKLQNINEAKTTTEDVEMSANSSLESSSSELIVRDTGATPTMSPNPKFKFAAGRRRRENEKKLIEGLETENREENEDRVTIESKDDNNEVVSPGMGNSSAISRSNSNSRCHRRKSRDVSGLLPSPASLEDDDLVDSSGKSLCPTSPRIPSNTPPILAPSQTVPSPSTSPLPRLQQRNSLAGVFAPVSTIPGLSLTESATMLITGSCRSSSEMQSPRSAKMEVDNEARRWSSVCQPQQSLQHPPSSWMGKKWDKWAQKRASGLLNDVSQTLANAFSLSTQMSTTPQSNSSTVSILDQDDDFVLSARSEPMKPTVVLSPLTTDMSDVGHHGKTLGDSEWDW